MKILVPIKQVSDPGNNASLGLSVADSQTKVINPFCAIALEEAVRLKEQGIATEVIAVSVSSEVSIERNLRKALANGADRAFLIEVAQEATLCPLDIAKCLVKLVEQEQPHLVLLGKQAVDSDNNQVGQMLSALLAWPQVTAAGKITVENNNVMVERLTDYGVEVLGFKLPGVITVDLHLNKPRSSNLAFVLAARKKPLEVISGAGFLYGESTKHVEILETSLPSRDVSLQMLGDVHDLAKVIKQHACR